jgi:AcrR family transcriptional regulator
MTTDISDTGRRYKGVDSAERTAQRRAKILDAAIELFGTRGYHATTLAMLSAYSSVPHRYLMGIFPDKEAILRAIHEQIYDDIQTAVNEVRKNLPANPVAMIRALVGAGCGVLLADERKLRIGTLEGAGISEEFEQFRHNAPRQYFPLVLEEIEKLVASGLLPRRDDFFPFVVGLIAAGNALMADWLLTPREQRPPKEVVIERISEFYRGIMLAALSPVPA